MGDLERHIGPAPSRSDKLGRYYTKRDIGAALVDQMTGLRPNSLLDLGAGGGSLSRAALARWEGVQLLTVDIDARAQTYLREILGTSRIHEHSHINADALSSKLPQLISARAQQIDAGVCNPPFISPRWRRGFAEILEEVGFSGCAPVLCDVEAALIFLAQNLRVLSAHATLGIILPDTLVSGAKYRRFRHELLTRYLVKKTVRLPRGSFRGTDALAHIVIISKGDTTKGKIPLQTLAGNGLSSDRLLVEVDAAIERLDYAYHAQQNTGAASRRTYVALGQVCHELTRGLLSTTEARSAPFPVFHTTDLNCSWLGTWRNLSSFSSAKAEGCQAVRARPGDILMARIGRNLESKILGVSAGSPVLTDCVYRIRVPISLRRIVLEELTSARGQAWLTSRTYGVSAKQLSKADLLSFPLPLNQAQLARSLLRK